MIPPVKINISLFGITFLNLERRNVRHQLPYAANCSLLFTEVPLLARPAAARAEGFDAVEFWCPCSPCSPLQPVPADREVDAFITCIRDAGVRLIGLNFFAGDLAGPDCGVLSVPARSAQFRDNLDVTVGIGRALGVGSFNALYGNRIEGVDPVEQDEIDTANLVTAAQAVAPIGGTVLVEPVSGPKAYPLRTAADVAEVLGRVRAAARPTSECSSTCSIWPATVTTSSRPSRRTATRLPMCRSPTHPVAGSRTAGSWTSTAT